MPQTSCYIDLNDDAQVMSYPDMITQTYGATSFPAGAFRVVNSGLQYNAFLHNPAGSNKIIKIKNLDYKFTGNSSGASYVNVIIGRAKDLSTGSIEPYDKFDSNAPDLPAGVGLTLNPLTTYTVISGSIRQRPAPIKNTLISTFGGSPNMWRYNNSTFYEAQKIGTTVQDITLNANEHLIIGFSANTAPNTKHQISVTFSSGSNTYYHETATTNSNFYINSIGTADRTLAAFVNNSNTSIKVHKIEINHLYGDMGYTSWGNITQGTLNTRQIMIDHVTKDRIPQTLSEDLVNSDSYDIIELDTTNTLPTNLKCYKNSVKVRPSGQFYIGADMTDSFLPVYIRTARFILPSIGTVGINPWTGAFISTITNHVSSIQSRLNYNRQSGDIIIQPGEGLGLLVHNISFVMDVADGNTRGHITFTVEDIPSTATTTETGFGY